MKKIILILSIFLLTGCYNYNELNNLAIVSSMYVDYDDGEYKVTLEFLNTDKEKKKASYFLESTGKTFEESLNNIYKKTDQQIYLSHMYIIVLSEKVAEDKLSYLYEYLMREPSIRKDFYITISDQIEEITKYEPEEMKSIGELLKMMIEYNEKRNAKFMTGDFRKILNSYLNEKSYIIGSIGIEDDLLTLKDNYLIYDNKLNQKIDENAVLFMNLLNENDSSFVYVDDENVYEIYQYKLEKAVSKDEMKLDLYFNVRLLNVSNDSNNSAEDMKKLQDKVDISVEKLINDCIDYSKNIGFDIYNFNYAYYQKFPKDVKSDTWKNLKYKINADITINEKGLIRDSIGDLYEK